MLPSTGSDQGIHTEQLAEEPMSLGERLVALGSRIDHVLVCSRTITDDPSVAVAVVAATTELCDTYLAGSINPIQHKAGGNDGDAQFTVLEDTANQSALIVAHWVLRTVITWSNASPTEIAARLSKTWLRSRVLNGCLSVVVLLIGATPEAVRVAMRECMLDAYLSSQVRMAAYGIAKFCLAAMQLLSGTPSTAAFDAQVGSAAARNHDAASSITPLVIMGSATVLQCGLRALRSLVALFRSLGIDDVPLGQRICGYEACVSDQLHALLAPSDTEPCAGGHQHAAIAPGVSLVARSSLYCILMRLSASRQAALSNVQELQAVCCAEPPGPSSSAGRSTTRLVLEQRLVAYNRIMSPFLHQASARMSKQQQQQQLCLCAHDNELLRELADSAKPQREGQPPPTPVVLPHFMELQAAFVVRAQRLARGRGGGGFNWSDSAALLEEVHCHHPVALMECVRQGQAAYLRTAVLPPMYHVHLILPLAQIGCSAADYAVLADLIQKLQPFDDEPPQQGQRIVQSVLVITMERLKRATGWGASKRVALLSAVTEAVMKVVGATDALVDVLVWVLRTLSTDETLGAAGLAKSHAALLVAAAHHQTALKRLCSLQRLRNAVLAAFSAFAEPSLCSRTGQRRHLAGIHAELQMFARLVRLVHPPLGHSLARKLWLASDAPLASFAAPAVVGFVLPSSPHAAEIDLWLSLSLPVLLANLTMLWLSAFVSYQFPQAPTWVDVRDKGSGDSTLPMPVVSVATAAKRRQHKTDADFFECIASCLQFIWDVCAAAALQRAASSKHVVLQHFFNQMVVGTITTRDVEANHTVASLADVQCAIAALTVPQASSCLPNKQRSGAAMVAGPWTAVRQRVLAFHANLTGRMRQVQQTRTTAITARDLTRDFSFAFSRTRTYTTTLRCIADHLEPHHFAAAACLRFATYHSLLQLQRADVAQMPETAQLRSCIPKWLRQPISIRDALLAYPSEKDAAALLKELGTAAIASVGSWSASSDAAATAPSSSPNATEPYSLCLTTAALRSQVLVDLVQLDMYKPFASNECLHIVAQVRRQVVEWLCRDERRHLVEILGGSAAIERLQRACATMMTGSTPSSSLPSVPQLRNDPSAHCRWVMHSEMPSLNEPTNSDLLQTTAVIEILLEITHWRYVCHLENMPEHAITGIDAAWRLTAGIVEPWCLSVCAPPPSTYLGARCPAMRAAHGSHNGGHPSTSVRYHQASYVPGIEVTCDASSVSVSPLWLPWWVAHDLITARWMLPALLGCLRCGSRRNAGAVIALHRARIAVLALLRAFGGSVVPHSDDRDAVEAVPCIEWLPVVDQLLALAAFLHTRGAEHVACAHCVARIVEATAVAYPEQVVWPLLYGSVAGGALQRVAATILATLSKQSYGTRMAVEAAFHLHGVLRSLCVLPVEQLAVDVRMLVAAAQTATPPDVGQPDGGDETTTKPKHPPGVAMPAEGATRRMCMTVKDHLAQFRGRQPITDAERFYRIELLPHTQQLEDAIGSYPDVSSLFANAADKVHALKDKIDRLLREQQQVAVASLVPENHLYQLRSLLQQHGVVLYDLRDAIHMSPMLWQLHRSAVAVSLLEPLLSTFPSAQRPKRVTFQLVGAARRVHFMIKGNEDLRRDQRLQRLLRVVSLTTPTNVLQVATYSVIPLSPNSGLVEWVADSETMGRLIQQYRGLAGIAMHREALILTDHGDRQMLANFDALNDQDKLHIFRKLVPSIANRCSNATKAATPTRVGGVLRSYHCELYNMLLNTAGSATTFLSRRRTFVDSLAAMSVLGDAIGLGDRHPSNILIDQCSFQITHIDIGDAFWVAQRRHRFPERVPFRATRMLERCVGIDGFAPTGSAFALSCVRAASSIAGPSDEAGQRGLLLLELLLPFAHSGEYVSHGIVRDVANRLSQYSGTAHAFTEAANLMGAHRGGSSDHPSTASGDKDVVLQRSACSLIQRWWKRCVRSRNSSFEMFSEQDRRDTPSHACGTRVGQGGPQSSTVFVDDIEFFVAGPDASRKPLRSANKATLSVRTRATHTIDDVEARVRRLIEEATLDTNISQHFSGWVPYW